MKIIVFLRVCFLVTLFSAIFFDVHSQILMASQSYSSSDTICKKILDNAKFKVIYRYREVTNLDTLSKKRRGFSILLVGDKYEKFEDYYSSQYDNLYDCSIKAGKSWMDILNDNHIRNAIQKRRFYEIEVIDKENDQIINQIERPESIDKLEYNENVPEMEWKLIEGDTVIAGYKCQKALTRFAGRDYVAWYAPDISLPSGPYKFGGLPGLILHVRDSCDHYCFTLYSFERLSGYHPIYIKTSNYHKGKRSKIRKIVENIIKDPDSGDPNLLLEQNAHLRRKIKPRIYNPIELE